MPRNGLEVICGLHKDQMGKGPHLLLILEGDVLKLDGRVVDGEDVGDIHL